MPIEDDGVRADDSQASIPIDRRTFVRLSAATAGAIAVPSSVSGLETGSLAGQGALYEFIVEKLSRSETIPTLVELSTPDFTALERYASDRYRTTTTPRPAAWFRLAIEDVDSVRSRESVERLRYSPGSNPFWLLGQYSDGVFPAPEDSVDFIDYEQMIDGITRLRERHSDRIRMRSAGESPGHRNLLTDEVAPKQLRVVEITDQVTDADTFAEKEKALFVLSIHGDERSGAEAGCRFIEQLLEGSEPAVESLLDEIALVFVFANPDGWVARNEQYGVDLDGDGTNEDNSFKRQTATGVDPNRQFPTAGWIDPTHFPAEPDGTNVRDDDDGVDDDVDERYRSVVPDALDLVSFFRSYDNLSIGSDLHGMFTSENFIEGLLVNDQYDHHDFHEMYEWNRQLEHRLETVLGDRLFENRDRFEALNERLGASTLPTGVYDYGTIFDTIQYTTTGTLISWMSQPESTGGLGMTMMAHEMGWDNRALARRPFLPWLTSLWVAGYQAVIRSTVAQLDRTVTAPIDTADRSTAVVSSGTLRRDSSDLSFETTDPSTTPRRLTAARQPARTSVVVPDGASQLSVSVAHSSPVQLTVRAPDGRVYATYNAMADRRSEQLPEWTIETPAAGDWTIRYKTVGPQQQAELVIRTTTLPGRDPVSSPDPVDALGYRQRSYSVSPLSYFDSYAAALADDGDARLQPASNGNITAPLVSLSVDSITDGRLFRGNSDRLAVESVVVSHDDGVSSERYLAELSAFVAAGGTLVLTDRGVSLLGDLETTVTDSIDPDAVTDISVYIPFLSERNESHPLLAGTRPIQRELWKVPPVGYALTVPGSAPLTVIDLDQFDAAGGTVAGYADADPFGIEDGPTRYVCAGTLSDEHGGTIHCLGSLLPPAEQTNLHPFGLLNYTTTFLGHTMLTNALGYRQRRFVDGELVATFGSL